MGNKVPVPDDRLQRMIDMLRLTKKDLGKMWRIFQRYDSDHGGTIDIEEFYKLIQEERTLFGDSLFELVDIDSSASLDFSEFVQTVGTYALFGRLDILKFCFFVFDKDKNGYIDSDELHALVEMLHANNPTSNCREALKTLDTNSDGRIDFEEFQSLNAKFPMLLFPAFRMQENMMINTLGKEWWLLKKETLQKAREEINGADERLRLKELQRQLRNQQRQVRHKMGFFGYYLCFFKRGKVLAKIAAEEALRQEKRAKKQQLREKQMQQKQNRKELENLFKDTDEDKAGAPGGDGDEDAKDADGKKKKGKKKKKKDKLQTEELVAEKQEELKKRRMSANDREEHSTKDDRAARKKSRSAKHEEAASGSP
jgi:Ca2+-binding EF-hand superfamily protein